MVLLFVFFFCISFSFLYFFFFCLSLALFPFRIERGDEKILLIHGTPQPSSYDVMELRWAHRIIKGLETHAALKGANTSKSMFLLGFHQFLVRFFGSFVSVYLFLPLYFRSAFTSNLYISKCATNALSTEHILYVLYF